jgi:hypothetical protein
MRKRWNKNLNYYKQGLIGIFKKLLLKTSSLNLKFSNFGCLKMLVNPNYPSWAQ